jgi:hypothetical protein
MRSVIFASEKGPDIAYYFGQNPGEAYRITKLHPYMQAAEIGRITEKFSSAKKPKLISGAPPPITPVSGGGEGAFEKDPDKMTSKEWDVWRNKTKKIL